MPREAVAAAAAGGPRRRLSTERLIDPCSSPLGTSLFGTVAGCMRAGTLIGRDGGRVRSADRAEPTASLYRSPSFARSSGHRAARKKAVVPRELPPRPHFDQLRRQARELLRAARADDSTAIERFEADLPGVVRGVDVRPLRLSHALTVIAREHGSTSWPRMKAHLAARPVDPKPRRRTPPHHEVARIASELLDLAARNDMEAFARMPGIPRALSEGVRDLLAAEGQLPALAGALRLGLRHPNPRVRYACAHALDQFTDEAGVLDLVPLLSDPVPRVRRVALHTLICDECKVEPVQVPTDLVGQVVELALHDPSVQVRRHATYALGRFNDPRAVAALASAGDASDEAIRRNARVASRLMQRGRS